jgi:hypothetical protein
MSATSPSQTIAELDLANSEEITLYLELIRIIEKDIDEIKEGNTRNGWTSWAILGGIAAVLLLFFGETRKLTSFPSEEVKTIVLLGILFIEFITLSLRVYSAESSEIKPGRVRKTKELFYSYIPSALYRSAVHMAALLLVFGMALPWWAKLPAAIVFFTNVLLNFLILVFYRKDDYEIGMGKAAKKGARLWFYILTLASVPAIILLGIGLRFPVGEVATIPYILAGLIIALLILVGYLIAFTSPSRLLTSLQDLRSDLIFRRVDIDEALRRYEPLLEGETLPDALQKALSDISNDLRLINILHTNMDNFIEKMKDELPRVDDEPKEAEIKKKQIQLDADAYTLHKEKCDGVLQALAPKLSRLQKKQRHLLALTDDATSEQHIRESLTRSLQALEANHNKLTRRFQEIVYYFTNPDKMPPLLKEDKSGGSAAINHKNTEQG